MRPGTDFLQFVPTGGFEFGTGFLLIFKLLVLVALVIYIGFLLVVVRQTYLLGVMLRTGISPILKLAAISLLVAALGILFLALILL